MTAVQIKKEEGRRGGKNAAEAWEEARKEISADINNADELR